MADYDPYTAALFQIESGGNPNAVTGSNRGLGQFSPDLEKRYGINPANRGDPAAQASAVAQEREEHRPTLERVLGKPTDADYYFAHQQGLAGAQAHIATPDQPAWQSIRRFYPSDRVAQSAIMGNLPASMKNGRDVNSITSGEFRQWWNDRFNRAQGAGGPMTAALSGGDVTGSVPQGRQMPTPMDQATSPGILDRLTQNIQNPDRVTDALGNAGAWLMARDNPAGGAALLAGLKKNKKGDEWEHGGIDTNTGQIYQFRKSDGAVRFTPIPAYDPQKSTKEAYDKDQAAADVKLNTELAEQGAALPGIRQNLTTARDAFSKVHDANPVFTQVKTVASQFGIPIQGLSDIQVAQSVSNKMALDAKNMGGKTNMPGAMSDSDREFLAKEVAQPSNTKEANQRILDIYEKQLTRQERVEKQRQDYVKANPRFSGNTFRQMVSDQDAQEAAAAAAAPPQPTAAPPPLAGYKF